MYANAAKPILAVTSQLPVILKITFLQHPDSKLFSLLLDRHALFALQIIENTMLSHTLLALATAATTSAHFVLNWPPTAGFNDDEEATGPCGGATVTVSDSSPKVQVGRFAAQIQSSHPTGNWQFRATLDTQEPYNWTNLSMVQTEGPGIFCLNYLSAPEDFAGKGGILQVVDYSGDGTLYQVCY